MPDRRRMLIDLGTGKLRPVIEESPALSSAQSPWTDILLEHHELGGPLELVDMAPVDHTVVVYLGDTPKLIEWKENGAFRPVRFNPGEVHLLPSMVPFSVRTQRCGNVVALSLDSKFLRCAAHDLFAGAGPLELQALPPFNEPLARSLVLALKAEAELGYPGGRAYAETLATSLAAHLTHRYSNARKVNRPEPGGLARHQLRRAIDFIHDHLATDVPLASMAAEAGLSAFHFARLFKRTTGLAPHQYLIQTRVERARELLLSTDHTTAQIAVQVGFCDQSHLTTHFRKVYGTTPRRFRQQTSTRKNRL